MKRSLLLLAALLALTPYLHAQSIPFRALKVP
jgi:hypothetical protein